jgi:Zinc finger, C3HC4 type (RING finger)
MRRGGAGLVAGAAWLCCLCLVATADSPAPADGGPVLDWSLVGYLADHHVGSSNYGHFGVRIRNSGTAGTLQASLFISSTVSRFFVARPRDLTLEPGTSLPDSVELLCGGTDFFVLASVCAGQERIVDIRAPLYLVEEESNLHVNASCSIQSNGGSAAFPVEVRHFPTPGPNVRVIQTTNGVYAWHISPVGERRQHMHDGSLAAAGFLIVLWCMARAVRIHLHGPMPPRCRRRGEKPMTPSHGDGDYIDDDEQALEAVRRLEAADDAGSCGADAIAARAHAKAQALEAWHAQTLASSGGGSQHDGVDEETGGPSSAQPASGSGSPACCSVCLIRPRDAALLPCRHVCLCALCAQRLTLEPEEEGRACPICRGRIDTWLQLYMA